MEGSLAVILWFGWAFVCALGIRVGFTLLFRPRLGDMAQIAAYAMWIVFVLAGLALVDLSGMQVYGFDASDPQQVIGYWVFFYSPLGLPTAFGAPAVLVFDLATVGITRWRRRRFRMSASHP